MKHFRIFLKYFETFCNTLKFFETFLKHHSSKKNKNDSSKIILIHCVQRATTVAITSLHEEMLLTQLLKDKSLRIFACKRMSR